MGGCEGGTVFDLLGVVLRRRSRDEAMIVRRRESKSDEMKKNDDDEERGKLYSCGLWLTGAPMWLFCSVPSVPPTRSLHQPGCRNLDRPRSSHLKQKNLTA